MKRILALLLTFSLLLPCAAALASELSSLTDGQLLALYRQVRAEAEARGLTLTGSRTLGEGRYIVGQDLQPGMYVITCVSTGAEDMTRSFGALGSALDSLGGQGDTAYGDFYASLGSALAALDEGVSVEIIGDYGSIIKSVKLKKGQSAALTLEVKTALKITDGTCLLEEK